ncbi:MAG: dipeptidase PepE, partial [Sutterella wadsworthensis]|nr:dipeptidase PepE [Sutterella wadsworthensis]
AAAGTVSVAQAKIKKPLGPQKVSEKRRVLIQSSSRYHTSGYLDFAGDQYEQLYGSTKHEILFIPYAKVAGTYDAYEKQVQDAFKPFGHKIISIHRFKDPQKAVREASAIAVGGGNTWALVTRMYEAGIIDLIRDQVNGGIPYCGWSAGGNVACPTLRTTNDMPIAEPPSFNTFGFIPFQTNPHFISGGTQGLNNETREDRLEEFMWYNKDEEVIGLPEGTALFVTGEHNCEVIGPKDSDALYWFRQAPKGMTLSRIPLGTKFDLREIRPGGKI